MKKLMTTILGLFLLITLVTAQDEYVEWVKEFSKGLIKQGLGDSHGLIVKQASEEWGTDYEMVAYEIKNQCKALYEFTYIEQPIGMPENTFKNIRLMAFKEWSEIKLNSNNEIIGLVKVDWEMVLYETKNQIEAYFEIF